MWQFDSKEGWGTFGAADQKQLEEALMNGELTPRIQGRQFDLQRMTQTNVKSQRVRKLRRIPTTASPRRSGAIPDPGETVEKSVSKLRMHNGQFWMTGRLDLYPSKLVFTPDQSEVRSHALAHSCAYASMTSVRCCWMSGCSATPRRHQPY